MTNFEENNWLYPVENLQEVPEDWHYGMLPSDELELQKQQKAIDRYIQESDNGNVAYYGNPITGEHDSDFGYITKYGPMNDDIGRTIQVEDPGTGETYLSLISVNPLGQDLEVVGDQWSGIDWRDKEMLQSQGFNNWSLKDKEDVLLYLRNKKAYDYGITSIGSSDLPLGRGSKLYNDALQGVAYKGADIAGYLGPWAPMYAALRSGLSLGQGKYLEALEHAGMGILGSEAVLGRLAKTSTALEFGEIMNLIKENATQGGRKLFNNASDIVNYLYLTVPNVAKKAFGDLKNLTLLEYETSILNPKNYKEWIPEWTPEAVVLDIYGNTYRVPFATEGGYTTMNFSGKDLLNKGRQKVADWISPNLTLPSVTPTVESKPTFDISLETPEGYQSYIDDLYKKKYNPTSNSQLDEASAKLAIDDDISSVNEKLILSSDNLKIAEEKLNNLKSVNTTSLEELTKAQQEIDKLKQEVDLYSTRKNQLEDLSKQDIKSFVSNSEKQFNIKSISDKNKNNNVALLTNASNLLSKVGQEGSNITEKSISSKYLAENDCRKELFEEMSKRQDYLTSLILLQGVDLKSLDPRVKDDIFKLTLKEAFSDEKYKVVSDNFDNIYKAYISWLKELTGSSIGKDGYGILTVNLLNDLKTFKTKFRSGSKKPNTEKKVFENGVENINGIRLYDLYYPTSGASKKDIYKAVRQARHADYRTKYNRGPILKVFGNIQDAAVAGTTGYITNYGNIPEDEKETKDHRTYRICLSILAGAGGAIGSRLISAKSGLIPFGKNTSYIGSAVNNLRGRWNKVPWLDSLNKYYNFMLNNSKYLTPIGLGVFGASLFINKDPYNNPDYKSSPLNLDDVDNSFWKDQNSIIKENRIKGLQ